MPVDFVATLAASEANVNLICTIWLSARAVTILDKLGSIPAPRMDVPYTELIFKT